MTLTEQFADPRSSEIAYEVTVENKGNSTINLHSVKPNIPGDAELVDVWEPLTENEKQRQELCKNMTESLSKTLEKKRKAEALSADFERRSNLSRSIFEFRPLSRWRLRLRVRLLLLSLRIAWKARRSPPASDLPMPFVITDANDATAWIARSEGDVYYSASLSGKEFLDFFQASRDRLLRLEKEGEEIAAAAEYLLPELEPGQSYETTYIFRFPKSPLATRRWKIAVGVTYTEAGSSFDKKYFAGKSTSRLISGESWMLSLIAVLASLGGLAVRVAFNPELTDQTTSSLPDFLAHLSPSVAIASSVLAFVFFNVYEYTDVGRKLPLGIGWRGAVLIGVLCGLIGDRILAAIQALVGA